MAIQPFNHSTNQPIQRHKKFSNPPRGTEYLKGNILNY
ncbi:hypothetical protein Cabys_2093 [Caldithrix abyssi DSM 13497]|uniref:Uncharacterized protein n=1 Tax=Caldithrix abyssi DSM 13497 TaxID=880073 RepID=A0A1J1CA26_CALAY|nr:hypothetical protein Cabys_2093 [Caldithrix abyssi DSM 13497]